MLNHLLNKIGGKITTVSTNPVVILKHIDDAFQAHLQNFPFFDVEVIVEPGKCTTTLYRKPTFNAPNGVYSVLSSVNKFGKVYTLVYRCFRICSVWTRFHTELTSLKRIFHKSGYPENFIDRCFRTFLDNIHLAKENVPIVEGKHLLLVLPYLGVLSLQTRTTTSI